MKVKVTLKGEERKVQEIMDLLNRYYEIEWNPRRRTPTNNSKETTRTGELTD